MRNRTVQLIAVGPLRNDHWRQAQADYAKRIRGFFTFEIHEIKDVQGQGGPESVALEKEGAKILEAVESAASIILLSPRGRGLSSEEWARFLQKQLDTFPTVTFIIGGPAGVSPSVEKKTSQSLSLSPMTFPHELARIVFLEQLYRGLTILKKLPYHK